MITWAQASFSCWTLLRVSASATNYQLHRHFHPSYDRIGSCLAIPLVVCETIMRIVVESCRSYRRSNWRFFFLLIRSHRRRNCVNIWIQSGSHHMLLSVLSQLQIFAMYHSNSNVGVQLKPTFYSSWTGARHGDRWTTWDFLVGYMTTCELIIHKEIDLLDLWMLWTESI